MNLLAAPSFLGRILPRQRTFRMPRMTAWNFLRHFFVAGLGLAAAMVGGQAHAQAYVNATVSGQIAPGVYGRVDIGNGPAPVLLFPQPVVVAPPAVYVPRSPIYMYVPPGHARHWSKHCARYAACGQPVYFVKEPPRRPGHFHGYRDRHDGRDHWRGHRRDDDRRDHGHRGHGRHDR
ncbi:hypothetical protein Alide2_2369 [Alicycliphilus denitrificans K601]|uniref:Uncharacterized protein n=3 Tax=Alicycliphilus denitrificans TaxID=179636 RepID=F4GC74_ALIDK|nr:hypothetical protein Alide2_2369 [Alicycliphilus denitrificans K601]